MWVLRWVIALPLIVVLILFSLANREIVSFTWSPVHPPIDAPLFLIALATCSAGFLTGLLAAWLAMGPVRAERRRQKKTIKNLEKELDAANENRRTAEKEYNALLTEQKDKSL